jgi:hypothetical protein
MRETMTTVQGKNQLATLTEQLIAGVAKHLTSGAPVTILGAPYTQAEITTTLQTVVTLRAGVNSAKAQTKAAIATETTQMPALRSFIAALDSCLRGAYGGSPDVLADFGLKPRKVRAPLTVEAKVAAVAKRASTRAARHTMGSVQKKAVKGDVTGVTLTPVTSAPVPTAPPAPASPTTSGTTPVTTTTHST